MKSPNILADAFARHSKVLKESEGVFLEAQKAVEVLAGAIRAGKKILTCGNGGSAADAEHFAASELVGRYHDDRRPLPAIALAANTTIANDYGYETVFSRQIEALGSDGDILVAFSTSGKSSNVLRAIATAKKKGMTVIAMTGAKGVALKEVADIAIVIPSEETARIQEMHELIYHAWSEYLDAHISSL